MAYQLVLAATDRHQSDQQRTFRQTENLNYLGKSLLILAAGLVIGVFRLIPPIFAAGSLAQVLAIEGKECFLYGASARIGWITPHGHRAG